MIGRRDPIKPFELIRWARDQASNKDLGLSRAEAHVLLLLATYCNEQAVAWPSIGRLGRDAGYKVRNSPTGVKCSAVSTALARLEELGLIWRKQAGHGKPATTELLFKPCVSTEPSGQTQPSVAAERNSAKPSFASPPSRRTEPSVNTEPKSQKNGQPQNSQNPNIQRPEEALRQDGGLHPSAYKDEAAERRRVRQLIEASLAEAAGAGL